MKISSFKPKRKMNNHVVGDFIQQKRQLKRKIKFMMVKLSGSNYFQCSSRTTLWRMGDFRYSVPPSFRFQYHLVSAIFIYRIEMSMRIEFIVSSSSLLASSYH